MQQFIPVLFSPEVVCPVISQQQIKFCFFPPPIPLRGCIKDNRWRTAYTSLSSLAPLPLSPPYGTFPSVLRWDTHISEMLFRRGLRSPAKIAAFICHMTISLHFLAGNKLILRCPIQLLILRGMISYPQVMAIVNIIQSLWKMGVWRNACLDKL